MVTRSDFPTSPMPVFSGPSLFAGTTESLLSEYFFQRSESWSVPIRGDSDAWASMATLRLLFVVSAAQTPSLPFLQYLDLVDGLPPTRPMGLYQAIPGCLFQSRFLVRSRID
ncbi:hypothetical protein SERLA73DRAFT_175657 [Serpula lacrymans var. lacrymans S7.3]|uniref:Uncharacterized protein n=1 Tax=Serpula lacrymans var. lacrymans (strain S7.3) TaxID=936435 RepID=F8PL43_SERL3|nr:hypothetical protein SERLA73DRAFT_175657 [Serpula lacrymans var. lacrymans S7.3]